MFIRACYCQLLQRYFNNFGVFVFFLVSNELKRFVPVRIDHITYYTDVFWIFHQRVSENLVCRDKTILSSRSLSVTTRLDTMERPTYSGRFVQSTRRFPTTARCIQCKYVSAVLIIKSIEKT